MSAELQESAFPAPSPRRRASARARRGLVVVKLGGDATATPERIAAAARRIVDERRRRDVVVVVSARRGITDQLLALVAAVDKHTTGAVVPADERPAVADRAVAAGEIVAASLVALALEHFGQRAAALDAREAGLDGDGRAGGSRITRIRPRRIRALLSRGVVPVVAGFQTHANGELAVLARGGTDVTAVALAAVLQAEECVLLKRAGLRAADPTLDPEACHVGEAGYDTLRDLLKGGAKVLAPAAAKLAERYAVPLAFEPFPEEGPVSRILPGLGEPAR